MKIEIWSDVVCPFCYIGKRHLEAALENFPHRDDVTLEYKAFQLDPNAALYNGQDYYENMAAKFGSIEKAKQMTANITEQAKAAGLDFHFDTMKPTNTFDAHRLSEYAKEHGKGTDIAEKLLYANFTESQDVGNHETLANIAEDAGLDKDEALAVLRDENAYREAVNNDIKEAGQLGASGVPFFVINRKYGISGAQPTETFTEALEKVWEEENKVSPLQNLSSDSDDSCGPDGCAVPGQE